MGRRRAAPRRVLPDADRPAGRLALLAAIASYQVAADDVDDVRRTGASEGDVVALTAWASLTHLAPLRAPPGPGIADHANLLAPQNFPTIAAMGDETPPPASLRERKKLATRAALSDAALRLALERGLENVLVEDIAAAAGVAPRTFNNYFPGKEAAIVAEGAGRAAAMRDALRARPAAEPLWTALRHALAGVFGHHGEQGEPDRDWVAKVRLIKATPALRVEQLRSDGVVGQQLAEEIARRTGTDSRRDLYPQLAAAAVTSAVRAALDHWLDAAPDTPLAAVVGEALDQLAGGLPPPVSDDPDRRPPRG